MQILNDRFKKAILISGDTVQYIKLETLKHSDLGQFTKTLLGSNKTEVTSPLFPYIGESGFNILQYKAQGKISVTVLGCTERKHRIYYKASKEDSNSSRSYDILCPNLVLFLKFMGNSLLHTYLYAVRSLPTSDSFSETLYKVPLPNIQDTGAVCTGGLGGSPAGQKYNSKIKEMSNIMTINAWTSDYPTAMQEAWPWKTQYPDYMKNIVKGVGMYNVFEWWENNVDIDAVRNGDWVKGIKTYKELMEL